jgi:hypothetical protein
VILHGVDFSGADSGGASKIRIVERNLRDRGGAVRVAGRVDRGSLLRVIRESAADGGQHAWRIDAPFGLPLETIAAAGIASDWRAVAEWMKSFGSPRGWRQSLRETTRKEPRRACDHEARTPMAPMNLRIFKQTWTLIAEVLLPLADDGIRIEPVANTSDPDAKVVVAEGCPSSVLQRYGWPHRGYKGGGDPPREVRAGLVGRLSSVGVLIPDRVAEQAIEDEEGDLLDALLLTTPPYQTVPTATASIEAWVY